MVNFVHFDQEDNVEGRLTPNRPDRNEFVGPKRRNKTKTVALVRGPIQECGELIVILC